MYILPIYIKRYKTKIKAECFVANIRFNTMYIYDKNGYILQSNPRGLICRNEKDKTIILKDRPCYTRLMGGVTALMIADGENDDEIIITSIAYHDWGGISWFVFAIVAGIYAIIDNGANTLVAVFFVAFIFFMNGLDKKDLKRQKEFIEKTIKDCEDSMLQQASAQNLASNE